MDELELKAALTELQTKMEGKTSLEVKAALKTFSEDFIAKNELATKAQKDAFDLEIKTLGENLEAKMAAAVKVVQDHADVLDAKLKKGASGKSIEKKHFNELLAEQFEEKNDDIEKFMRKESSRLGLEIKAVGDMSTANVTGGSRYGQIMAPGIIESPRRKVHMSDIIQGGSIGPGNSYTFMRENGVGEGNPAPTAEGATKPQMDLDLIEATVQVENIAGWLRVTNKAMRNIPGFLAFLQSRLPEKFQRVMDAQILYGNGTSPNLKGILTSGNFVASTSTLADQLIEKIIDDIATLEDTYERDANGILLRPVDFYGFFKNKAAGSGEYDLPQGVTIVGGQLMVLGVPAYASTAITAPDYVVGDFNQGVQLLTQESMRVEFFREDGTNVRDNKVTVRIEGDFALPVYGPDYFIKGTTAQE